MGYACFPNAFSAPLRTHCPSNLSDTVYCCETNRVTEITARSRLLFLFVFRYIFSASKNILGESCRFSFRADCITYVTHQFQSKSFCLQNQYNSIIAPRQLFSVYPLPSGTKFNRITLSSSENEQKCGHDLSCLLLLRSVCVNNA
jgi:hypothetical protein